MTISNPTPQRHLRAHRPDRLTERAALTPEHQTSLAARLTPRDRWLARMLHEHRVLTSTQTTQLAFSDARLANRRLRELYQRRIVDRFQPFRTVGSAPMHYVLDVAGAAILAAEDGLSATTFGYRHDRTVQIAHSLQLAHTVAVNGVFAALVAVARHSVSPGDRTNGAGARALTAWWSEARCARYYGDQVRPDGYGRWRENDGTQTREVDFFFEYDFGTEPLTRVATKLADYHRLTQSSGIVTPVLFWFPTEAREAAARAAMTALMPLAQRLAVPVATTCTEIGPNLTTPAMPAPDSPAGPRWHPLGTANDPSTNRRVRLARLADHWPRPRDRKIVGASDPAVDGQHRIQSRTDSDVDHRELGSPHPMPPDLADHGARADAHPGRR